MHHLTTKLTALALFAALALFPATKLLAGDLDSPAAPTEAGSAMYTLEDIFDRLDTGAAGTKRGGAFVEPAEAPAGTGRTLDEVMHMAPAVDDVDGATAAEVAKDKTFWGLRSGEWGIQTGTLEAGDGAGVPKTGQTSTVPLNPAPEGSDGDLQRGVAWPDPRFTDNGDGTVTDNLTNLVWLKNANCFGQKNWTTALADANALADDQCDLEDGSSAGDWRLPNVMELLSLIAWGYSNPALADTAGTAKWEENNPFTGVLSSLYWSSTTLAGYSDFAWYVVMGRGYVLTDLKSYAYHVWPVRAGQ